ncbi:MAG: hypothetical protein IT427_04940 [Pirellulales bacterium]|nr:hypothetical protein [Pirellulales bacterium]
MSVELQHSPLAPRIQSLLAGLRLRIRGYVWTQGLAAIIVALGATFWLTLAFDWLFEPPWQFRLVMLVAVAAGIFAVAKRYLFQRAFRPLDDGSMALLLERRYRDYQDSLLTTVELGTRPHHSADFNQEMLGHTREQAIRRSQRVRLSELFRLGPLLRMLVAAALLSVSVLGFAVLARGALNTWIQRVVLLDSKLLWPRSNHVRVVGFSAERRIKVAKGSDFSLVAVADLRPPFRRPETVQVRFRTEQGARGRDNMTTVGVASPHDQEQRYSYVFKGVTSPVDIDVFGGDDRDRGFRIDVVDNPTISKMDLACDYPAYTGRVANTVPASALVQLPQGTKVTIRCEANKDLVDVQVAMVQGDKASLLAEVRLPEQGNRRHFEVKVPPLMEDTALSFELHDTDDIRSRDPVKIVLAMRPDDPPIIALRLRGISTAITPDARLPVIGEVRDDYGLTRVWFEYQLAEYDPAEQDFHVATTAADGRPKPELAIELSDNEVLDLKRLRELAESLERKQVHGAGDLHKLAPEERRAAAHLKSTEQIELAAVFKPKVGQKINVNLGAADNCELFEGQHNEGKGERYQLDVVAPETLLSMLEGRELMLRRRFETIYQELVETRDTLARIDFTPTDLQKVDQADEDPDERLEREANAAKETPEERLARFNKRALELRELRSSRAVDNSNRAAHETLSVAESFDDIREEMANNRVDTPELESRLKNQIADPLRAISAQQFPKLLERLKELTRALDDPASGQAARDASLEAMDRILLAMKAVLDKMLELESFNEVVEKLRQIIEIQHKIHQQTQQRQKDDLKNKLRGLQD